MTTSARIGRRIGAAIGFIAFLIFGLVPGFYFGSYGSLVVLKLLGSAVEPSILARIVVVVGTMLGLFCMASVSIVLGAVFGTAIGYLTDLATKPARKPAEAKAKAH